MARLAGKVAFITGGGRGIGRATAERFAEEGAKVVIAEIDAKSGEAAAQSARARVKNSGGDAHFVQCDVRERTSVEIAFAETVKRFGGLHILHNNAGGSTLQDGPVTAAPEEEFWRVIKLDLFAHYLKTPGDMPAEWAHAAALTDEGARARHIADYIAGMTDRYALIEHAKYFKATPELR